MNTRVDRFRCLAPVAVGASAFLVLNASPLLSQDPGALDRTVLHFRDRALFWSDAYEPYALRTFVLLGGIEFAVSAVLWVLATRKDTLNVEEEFLRKFSFVAFWYAVMFSWEIWFPPIYNSFTHAGVIGAQIGTLNPSEIVDIGIDIWNGMGWASASFVRFNPISGLIANVAGLITLLGFIVAAVAVAYTIIQGWLVMGTGILFLAFAGWRSTAQLADNYLGTLLYVGIKLMVLYLVVGVGILFGNEMVTALHGSTWTDMGPAAWCIVAAVLFAALVTGLPVFFAGRITQGHSFGLVSAIRAQSP